MKHAAGQSSPNITLEGEGRSGDVEGVDREDKMVEEMKVKKVTQKECLKLCWEGLFRGRTGTNLVQTQQFVDKFLLVEVESEQTMSSYGESFPSALYRMVTP